MKRKTWILVLSTMCLIFIITALSWYLYKSRTDNGPEYEYFVEVTGAAENFSILVPFPVNQGYSTLIYSTLTFLSGTGNYTIENTIHGIALNISSGGDFKLRSKGRCNIQTWDCVLSMFNYSEAHHIMRYYIFSTSNKPINITITFDLWSYHPYNADHYRIEGSLSKGWNLIAGDVITVEE